MTKLIHIENIDEAIKIIEKEGNYLYNSGELWSVIGEDGFYIVEPAFCKEDVVYEYFRQ